MEKNPTPLGGIGSMLSLSWESSMTNLASGDGEGDVEIAVHFLLGFLNRHLVGPLLELHIHIQRSPASWPSDGVTFLLEVNPVSEALLCNSGFQFRYVPVPQDG